MGTAPLTWRQARLLPMPPKPLPPPPVLRKFRPRVTPPPDTPVASANISPLPLSRTSTGVPTTNVVGSTVRDGRPRPSAFLRSFVVAPASRRLSARHLTRGLPFGPLQSAKLASAC